MRRTWAAWAGLCSGNAESAGKRFSGRTRNGDRYVRRILTQSAWCASRTKGSFLQALFFPIARKRVEKKATVAVADRILTVVWRMPRDGVAYKEQGGDFFDRLDPQRTARQLTRRLERIGFQVTLIPRVKVGRFRRTRVDLTPKAGSSEGREVADIGCSDHYPTVAGAQYCGLRSQDHVGVE